LFKEYFQKSLTSQFFLQDNVTGMHNITRRSRSLTLSPHNSNTKDLKKCFMKEEQILREAFKKKTGYFMTSSKIHLLPTHPT
jgi:hypothetical protein